ncbi:thioredoxin family protein [Winogradskyella sp. A3E31]|uniref:thioredoxin family protein n=1 Tax=Winogradskyella sp. A3E31 TaxID=3349637 RepID=UPI00398B93AE
MKRIVLIGIIALFTVLAIPAQEINWVSLDEAIALQKKNPKKIMMDVYTNWCGPCKLLDKNTFHNKDVVDYVNEHYYAVKFNAEGNDVVNFDGKKFENPGYKPENANRRNSAHQFTRFLKVNAYPTIVFLDEEQKMIAPIRGYQKPKQLELYLKLFKSDEYKSMTTQEAFNTYFENFKPEFKDSQ